MLRAFSSSLRTTKKAFVRRGWARRRRIDRRRSQVTAQSALHVYRAAIAQPHLSALAEIAARIFISAGDFIALHRVTGCHPTRLLQPFLLPSALDVLATAMLAAYVV